MNVFLIALLKKIVNFFGHVGIDLRKIWSFMFILFYVRDIFTFLYRGGKIENINIVLSDYRKQAGLAFGHYFHQDLLVAGFINKSNPKAHLDIGSRIDGFVAHVASFRSIDVMDIRTLNDNFHENINFVQKDLMAVNNSSIDFYDSISCLHAIEHFGLGRYRDKISPNGHIDGFNNILKLLKVGGYLYISFPIGEKTSTYFNAHRIFHPKDIFSWPSNKNTLKLERFDFVDDFGMLHKEFDLTEKKIKCNYGCGIYTFKKIN